MAAHADSLREGRLTVLCYPHRYDSVSFYYPRASVRCFDRGQRTELVRELARRSESLLLVKSGDLLKELLRELPETIEFAAAPEQGAVTVGWVRRRGEPASSQFARR